MFLGIHSTSTSSIFTVNLFKIQSPDLGKSDSELATQVEAILWGNDGLILFLFSTTSPNLACNTLFKFYFLSASPVTIL